MDSELYKTIYNLLQNQNELHFTTKSGGQGGEIIEVFLNEKHIGEVYMYDNKQDRWANVPHGTEEELNLGQDVKQWIYDYFFPYAIEKNCICDSYEGYFEIDETELGLGFSGESTWEGQVEENSGYMGIEQEEEE